MKKKIRTLLLVVVLTLACASTSLACTPKLATPKISIPNISGSVTLPAGAKEAAKKAGQEAAKKVDWSKFKFTFIR